MKKYLFIAIVVILIVISFFIIRSFITSLISAFILAYLMLPLYNKINKKLKNKNLSALICIILALLVLLIPTALVFRSLITEASKLDISSISLTLKEKLSSYGLLQNVDLQSLKQKVTVAVISLITSTLTSLPALILGVLITVLGTFYILTNWTKIATSLSSYLPFDDKKRISQEIAVTTDRIIYGYLLIAIIEFVISLIGFYLAGTPYFFLLAAIVAATAFLPALGPGIVWIPVAIYHFIHQSYTAVVIVIITGLIISVGIDVFLRLRLLGKNAHINPLIMFLGILGGVPIFGIFGFVIGPLILVYTIKLVEEAINS